MALGVLTNESVARAVAEYDELGRDAFLNKYGFGRATSYALVVDGQQYDPKAIAGVAFGHDHPDLGVLKNTEFNGGRQLRRAFPSEYEIVLRTDSAGVELRDLIESFLTEYLRIKAGRFGRGSSTYQDFQRAAEMIQVSAPLTARADVRVRWSLGRGNWAGVPWIAFLDRRVTDTTQYGVYPVMLFREDMSGVYMTLAQGTQDLKKQGRQHMLEQLEVAATRVRSLIDPDLRALGFAVDNEIRLGDGNLARDYEASTIVHKFYRAGEVPADAQILEDLDAVLDLSDADIAASHDAPTQDDLPGLVQSFREAVDASGLKVPTGHGDRVAAFISALVVKPFVILTGTSGSGKTQLAMRLGDWFGSGPNGRRYLPVAVRPDWTGPEALFGYEDALRAPHEGRASWFVPDTLEFMLNASREPDMPHLLLLDEMNLAHVERYFSDFLSGIESRDAVLPNLVREADSEWRVPASGEQRIPLPRNLFVVGTVNVDETTYQFSPKVLDRATTFEIRTRTEDLDEGLRRPTSVPSAAPSALRAMVSLVIDDNWGWSSQLRGPIAWSLRRLHATLTESDDEFGHRVFYEGLRFAGALEQCGVSNRDAILDHIVVLKVLPRIHGSRRRVEPVLRQLEAFCVAPDGSSQPQADASAEPALPLALTKVRRMLRAAEVNQFVSFTD